MSPRVKLKWLVRNNVKEAEKFVQDYNIPTRCISPDKYNDVLNDSSVDAVIIASSTNTHEDLITRSINAGKHIFCEKPITATIQSTENCYKLAEQATKHLFCAFHRRFDPSLNSLKDKLDKRILGNPRLVKISSHDIAAPPIEYIKNSQGGILSDSTIHDLDLSRWLIQSRPTNIFVASTAFDPEVAKYDCDLVIATLQFENGVISFIDNGRQASFGYDQRTEVLCDKGALTITNRYTDLLNIASDNQSLKPNIDKCFSTRYADAYRNELEHFLDVLQGKCGLKVSKKDVLEVQKLIEAATKSLEIKAPVSLI